ncbi:unnamed protein product [Schistosoma mattheei]|uniref:F-box domain-containing protein n=1 Tax=Schistosoma mattheei TaxID=31246 RepID=A0AA85BVS1_9TREM|nr:unnamed protein product [Schistosoma mattheei]
MGLVLALQHSYSNQKDGVCLETPQLSSEFVDLHHLPAELALNILSRLNATDLYLASCVWYDLAYDEVLWKSLCKASWPFCSAYKNGVLQSELSFRRLYLKLDEARLTFNADAFEIHSRSVDIWKRGPGSTRTGEFKRFPELFITKCVKRSFTELPVQSSEPSASAFIHLLVGLFSERFTQCNPDLGVTRDEIYLLCFSMIMLSVDLWSPSIKIKCLNVNLFAIQDKWQPQRRMSFWETYMIMCILLGMSY